METHNLLAHKMKLGGPVFFKQGIVLRKIAQGGYIVAKRVQPDVNGMVLVKRHGYAPFNGGAGDA